jgi:O-antigen/teichoic acid export membrane protein
VMKQPLPSPEQEYVNHMLLIVLLLTSVSMKALSTIGETRLFYLKRPLTALSPKLFSATARVGCLLVVLDYEVSNPLMTYVWIFFASEVLQLVCYWTILRADFLQNLFSRTVSEVRQFSRQTLPFSAVNVGFQIEQNLEKVLIGALLSLEWLAFYMIALRIVDVVEIAARQLVGVLLPRFAAELRLGGMGLSEIALTTERDLIISCMAIYIGLLMLTPSILSFLGSEYEGAYSTVMALAFSSLLLVSSQPRIQALNASVYVRAKVSSSLILRAAFIAPLALLFFGPWSLSELPEQSIIFIVLLLKAISRVIFLVLVFYYSLRKSLVRYSLRNNILLASSVILYCWGINNAIYS